MSLDCAHAALEQEGSLVEEWMRPAADDVHHSRFRGLTPREARLFVLAAREGLGRHDLGERLEMSPASVANTVQTVRRKLGVPARQELGQFVAGIRSLALECGLDARTAQRATPATVLAP